MKLAHIIRQPRLAGAELLVTRLCDQHIRAGVVPHIIATHPVDPSATAMVEQVRSKGIVFDAPAGNLSRLQRIRFLRQRLGEAQPAVAFAHTVLPSLFARLAAGPLGIPVITVLHGAARDYSGVIAIAERVAPRPTAVVGVAKQNIAWYREQFGDRVPFRLIANGVDLDLFRSLPALRAGARDVILDTTGKDRIYLHIGRLAPVKRQDISIAAFERLSPDEQRKSLLIIAGLTEDAAVEAAVRRAANRNPNIRFLGAPAEVSDLFAAADVVLVPSDDEAHPAVVIEGLCSQSKVIASDIPAHQFARNFEGVVLVQGAADMATVMSDSATTRYNRPLTSFDIGQTARNYEANAREFSQGE